MLQKYITYDDALKHFLCVLFSVCWVLGAFVFFSEVAVQLTSQGHHTSILSKTFVKVTLVCEGT